MPEVKAISICTPPRGRLDLVREAIAAGLDIMLEKPPAATIGEAEAIAEAAAASNVVLHATWHSREAAAVEPALPWLAARTIRRVAIPGTAIGRAAGRERVLPYLSIRVADVSLKNNSVLHHHTPLLPHSHPT